MRSVERTRVDAFVTDLPPFSPTGEQYDPEFCTGFPFKLLSETAWLKCLFDLSCTLCIERGGYVKVTSKWGIKERRLNEHRVYFVVRHSMQGTVDDGTVELGPGSFFWIPPGVRHTFRIPEGGQPPWFYFLRFSLVNKRKRQDYSLQPRTRAAWDAWPLQSILRAIVHHMRIQPSGRGPASLRMRSLFVLLSETFFNLDTIVCPNGGLLDARQRSLLGELVWKRVREWPSPADLAAELGLSPQYFSRIFRKTYGMSARQWLVRERLKRAADILTTTRLNVSQVAYKFGYRSIHLFSRQFRMRYGCAPSEYRKRLV